jgi:RNA polymerase sigma-70 factor (ECF subfamily)
VTEGSNWTSERDGELLNRIGHELPALVALARRMTGDEHEAQDAVQDALERAWRARAQLRDPAAAGGWLRSILARQIVDRHRARGELPVAQIEQFDDLLPDLEDPAAVLAAAEDDLVLRAALRSLSEPDRVAIVLHDGEGWSAGRVAELMGTGVEAAHKRIQRARVRLMAALAQGVSASLPPAGSCRFARAHAHELLDGTLDEPGRTQVQEHLDTCQACPATLQAAVGVLSRIRASKAAEPLPDRVREQLAELVAAAEGAS